MYKRQGLDATILDGDDAAAETTSSDTAAAGSSSSSSRRRRVLLSGNDADTSSIDIPATFARVEGAASGLAGLLAASTPMGGAKLGGTPSMCMAGCLTQTVPSQQVTRVLHGVLNVHETQNTHST